MAAREPRSCAGHGGHDVSREPRHQVIEHQPDARGWRVRALHRRPEKAADTTGLGNEVEWNIPVELDNRELCSLIGVEPHTPLDEAVARCLRP